MNDSSVNKHRVLLTGASGAMGKVIGPALVERGHFVRGFSRRSVDGMSEMHCGDLTDRDVVQAACDGVDTIVHLGAYPNPADFLEVLLQPNVIGLYNVMEAAVQTDVKRVILASTIQTVSGKGRKREGVRGADEAVPGNHYALTKVWAEAMGEMYARCHQMSVLAVRICWFVRNQKEAEHIVRSNNEDVFLSWDDTCRFYTLAVEAAQPAPGEYACVYAVSKPLRQPTVDMQPARDVIGYEPQDVWPNGLGFEV